MDFRMKNLSAAMALMTKTESVSLSKRDFQKMPSATTLVQEQDLFLSKPRRASEGAVYAIEKKEQAPYLRG